MAEKLLSKFVVFSWNVLHIIHELNYSSENSLVLDRYSIKENLSNEKQRLNDIVKVLTKFLSEYYTIQSFICLQEVPGDLVSMLNEMCDAYYNLGLLTKPMIYIQTYSRIPKLDDIKKYSPYVVSNESLVIMHYNPSLDNYRSSKDQVIWTPCPVDAGKGALTLITESGLKIVNIHVPYDNTAASMLLGNLPWPGKDKPFICVGDMNRYSENLMTMISEVIFDKVDSSLLLPITTEQPTRVDLKQDGTRIKTWIDHFVISASLKSLIFSPAIVYDNIGDISDHCPILLQFKDE